MTCVKGIAGVFQSLDFFIVSIRCARFVTEGLSGVSDVIEVGNELKGAVAAFVDAIRFALLTRR